MWQRHRRWQGFTLIEVMVVVIIVLLLVAILIPVIGKVKEQARQSTCLSNQRQIVSAILIYTQDNDETLPSADQVWGQVHLGRQVLSCPTKGDGLNDYVYSLKVSGEKLSTFPQTGDIAVTADGVHNPIASEPLPNIGYQDADAEKRHDGQLIACYLDGHAALTKSVSLNALDLYNWITGVGVTPLANMTVTASSSASGSSPTALIDGVASADPNTNWLCGSLSNAWVQIDLGRRQAVSAIRCWNYCQPNNDGCGTKTLSIYLDDIPQQAGSTLSTAHANGLTVSLPESTSSCADGGVWKLPVTNGGRYVTLVLEANYGGNSVGLAEVGVGVDKDTSPGASTN